MRIISVSASCWPCFQWIISSFGTTKLCTLKSNSLLFQEHDIIYNYIREACHHPNWKVHKSWDNLQNRVPLLKAFYAPSAIFSLTVEHSSASNPLSTLLPVSRNLLDGTDDNCASGPDQIISCLEEIFPDGLSMVPTHISTKEFAPGLLGAVLHGTAQLSEDFICDFDRSLIIGIDGETILVTNDHIFFSRIKE